MWTQADFFHSTVHPLLTLGGPLTDSPDEIVRKAVEEGGGLVTFALPPLMHGAALWVSMMAILGGNKLVLTGAHRLDPHAVWQTVDDEKVVSISLVGDAMARPLVEVLAEEGVHYDLSNLFVVGSGGAILSATVKAKIAELLPNVMIVDSLGASETGYQGTFSGTDDDGRPRFTMGEHTTVLDEDGKPVVPGSGVVGRLARSGIRAARVLQGRGEDGGHVHHRQRRAGGRCRATWPRSRPTARSRCSAAGRCSINSGGEKIFPEEVESALKSHPRRVRRGRRRRARRALGRAGLCGGEGARRTRRRRSRSSRALPRALAGVQGAARAPPRRRDRALPVGQGRLPLGQGEGSRRPLTPSTLHSFLPRR